MDKKLSWVYMTCGSLDEARKYAEEHDVPMITGDEISSEFDEKDYAGPTTGV